MLGGSSVSLANLKARLSLDNEEYKAGLSKAQQITKTMGKGLITIFAGVSAAITKMTLDTVRFSEETLKASQAMGMTTDETQELSYAAQQADTSIESFQRGMTQLLMQMSRARDGSEESRKSFEKLGVSYKNQDGTLRSTKDVLMDIAGKMKSGELSADQLAIATDLLGARTMKELVPALMKGKEWFKEMGDEAHNLGIIMSEKDVKAAEDFGDKFDTIKNIINGFKRSLTAELFPTLQTLYKVFLNPEKLKEYRESFAKMGTVIANVIGNIPLFIGAIKTSFLSFQHFILTLRKDLELLQDNWFKFQRTIAIQERMAAGWNTPWAKIKANEIRRLNKELEDNATNVAKIDEEMKKNEAEQDKSIDYYAGLSGKMKGTIAEFEILNDTTDETRGNLDDISGSPEGSSPGGGIAGVAAEVENLEHAMVEATWANDELMKEMHDWMQEYLKGQQKSKDITEETAESVGELFGTYIKEGGSALAMLKKIIGQQIRYNLLSKLGWQGQLLGGFMQVFGFQHGGVTAGMPIVNMAVMNENKNIPEVGIEDKSGKTGIFPIEKLGKFINVKINVRNALPNTLIDYIVEADPAAFDKFWRYGARQASERDLQR